MFLVHLFLSTDSLGEGMFSVQSVLVHVDCFFFLKCLHTGGSEKW